jgi:NADH:ubiquinone reductase (H+-translocating)
MRLGADLMSCQISYTDYYYMSTDLKARHKTRYNNVMDKKNIVILGAGFGGLRSAMDIAKGLARLKLLQKYQVILIDRSDCHTFIPLLYKVAARPEPEHENNCSYDITSLIEGLSITFIQGEIVSPDIASGMIALKDGQTIHADYLVIALGSETNYFGIAGLKEHALQLKTIESALQVRTAVSTAFAKGGDVKIVAGGGGPNGLELAGELRLWANEEERKNPNLHVSVSIVEAMPTILPGFDLKIVSTAMRRLKKLNIDVKAGMKIGSVSENTISVGDAVNANAMAIPFDVFIWTGGTKTPDVLAAVPVAKEPRGKPMAQNGMECLPATPDLTLAPMVYAVGDNVCFINPKTQKPVPAVAHAAVSEGAVAAHNVLEEIKKAEVPGYQSTAQTYTPNAITTYAYVIPIGERWAAAKIGPFIFSGWLGWSASRVIELNYLWGIMPPGKALKAWLRM